MFSSVPLELRSKLLSTDNKPLDRAQPTFGKKPLDYLFLVAGCVAFVASRNLTTQGAVKIDQFEYWLIGLIPFAVIVLASRAVRHQSSPDRLFIDEGILLSSWLLSLLLFVALRVTLQSEAFEFPLYRLVSYNPLASELILSLVYSVLGSVVATAIRHILSRQTPAELHPISAFFIGTLFVAVLFFLFIFSF